MTPTEHILVIRFSAMGDVAMTAPIIEALAKQYPHVRITMLSQRFARPFFAHMPSNVSFMEADLRNEYHGVKGLNALFRRLVAKRFTAVADLHGVLRSNYLRLRFCLAGYRTAHINKHRLARRRLVAQRNKRLAPLPTSFDNYAAVFAQLGYPIANLSPAAPVAKEQGLSADKQAGRSSEASRPLIGLAPFAAHKGKTYPPELMERVVGLLAAELPTARLYLFGVGKDESRYFAAWCEKYPQCVNASAELKGLDKELELMSRLDVMVSMDSSNMHMASLVGTTVVSVWGATHPYAGFMGWGQTEDNACQVDMPCRPCSIFGNKPCAKGDYPCMRSIQPEDIVAKVKRLVCKPVE